MISIKEPQAGRVLVQVESFLLCHCIDCYRLCSAENRRFLSVSVTVSDSTLLFDEDELFCGDIAAAMKGMQKKLPVDGKRLHPVNAPFVGQPAA